MTTVTAMTGSKRNSKLKRIVRGLKGLTGKYGRLDEQTAKSGKKGGEKMNLTITIAVQSINHFEDGKCILEALKEKYPEAKFYFEVSL